MCLSKVDEVPSVKSGIGYKIVHQREDGSYHYGCIRSCGGKFPSDEIAAPLNQWVRDPRRRSEPITINYPFAKYTPGFHIFPTTKALRMFNACNGWYDQPVLRVKFRNVVATGTQEEAPTIVARSIMRLSVEVEKQL